MQFLSMLNMHYWHICSMMCCCASGWSDSNRSSEGTTGGRYNTASSVLGWRQLLDQGRRHSFVSPCFIMLLWYGGVPGGVFLCSTSAIPTLCVWCTASLRRYLQWNQVWAKAPPSWNFSTNANINVSSRDFTAGGNDLCHLLHSSRSVSDG